MSTKTPRTDSQCYTTDFGLTKSTAYSEHDLVFASFARNLKTELESLRAENASLRADKARLDWLDRNPRKISNAAGYRGEQDTWSYFDAQKVFHDAPTIRAAIDAARAALGEGPK